MKFYGPWMCATTVTRADGTSRKVYDVRWRVVGDDGTEHEPRKRCANRSDARDVRHRVELAAAGHDGWMFDDRGRPHRPAFSTSGDSLLTSIETFVLATFPTLRPSTRTRNESVLIRVVAGALPADDRGTLYAALKPASTVTGAPAIAARYLREYSFNGRADRQRDDDHADGYRWLIDRLPTVSQLDERFAAAVWEQLVAGRGYATARTYLAVVHSWVRWMIANGHLERDPFDERMKLRRDLKAERVDPRRVPDTSEVDRIARHVDAHAGPDAALLVRIMAAAGLRISEAIALERRHLVHRTSRWVVRLDTQRPATVKRHGWDVGDRQARKEAKDVTSVVEVPLPVSMTPHIEAALRRLPNDPAEPLCRGRRGRPIGREGFRGFWNAAVAAEFPGDHLLAGITPHALRHHAMTTWLRSGVDPKRCQQWGRWEKLSVMLDTYAGVFASDDDTALDRLDRNVYGGEPDPADASDVEAGTGSGVTRLDQYRLHPGHRQGA